MNQLRVAVVGAGRISAQHFPVLLASPDIQLTAVCESDPARLQQAAETHGVANRFDSIDRLLEWGHFDAVWVLVSHHATAAVAERFIRAKIPTFLEKPPGTSVAETQRLVQAVEETGVTTQVGLNRRFYSSTQAAKKALLQTGPILSVNLEGHEDVRKVWKDPRFTDAVRRVRVFCNTIHALDHLRIFGGEVDSVSGFCKRFTNPMPDAYTGYVEFASGAIGRALVDHFGDKGNGHQVEVRTATATLRSFDGFARYVMTRQDGDDVEFGLSGDDLHFKPGFAGQTREFIAAVAQQRQPAPPGGDHLGRAENDADDRGHHPVPGMAARVKRRLEVAAV